MRTVRPINVVAHAVLSIAAMLCAVPFVWLIASSLQTGSGVGLGNFRQLVAREGFSDWIVNSIFLACTQTVLIVTLSGLGGFALAKYEFRGRRVLLGMMLVTVLLPGQVLLPGGYELMQTLGWLDSYAAILVPGAVSMFGLFLFRQAMRTVPDELLHAARIDGCSELRLWWEVALPIVRPMTGAFTLMTFLGCWNSFLWPQIILQTEQSYTLPMGLANMMSLPEYQRGFRVLMAGTLLSTLPVFLLFISLQKDFVSGLTSGAVKG